MRREAMRRAVAEEEAQALPAPVEASPTPPPKPPPIIVNVGTRVDAVLTDPVVTGIALAPATARLAKDLYIGDRLAIPAGTLLAGEAFSTQDEDRAQVVFTALVKDGRTVQFEGWALQLASPPGFTSPPGRDFSPDPRVQRMTENLLARMIRR